MPFDTRRINGPDTSYPPSKFEEDSKSSRLSDEHKREDGRQLEDLRPVFLKVGVVSQAKGSAYIEMGKTKVICAVYGPREIAKKLDFGINGKLYCDFKYAPFSCQLRKHWHQDGEERDLSQVLKQALEPAVCLYKFPKAEVDVFVIVMDNDGGALSGAITAASLALTNAGIPMYDLLIGCNLHCNGRTLVLDPTASEEKDFQSPIKESIRCGNLTLGLMPSLQQVTCLVQDGVMEKSVVIQAIKTLIDKCHQLHPVLQSTLIKSWKQEVKENILKTETAK